MRVLGLDIGERRIGVALSDPDGRIATPHVVLDAASALQGRALTDLLGDWDPGLIVIGIPVSLDGEEGPQAKRIREAAATLIERLDVPVVFQDERLSSAEAGRRMAEAGLSEKERRGKVDMVAASIILQSYLDANPQDVSASHAPSAQNRNAAEGSGDDSA